MGVAVTAPLSGPMRGTLLLVRYASSKGYDAPEGDVTLRALARRGLVERRGTRAAPRIYRWFATVAGCELVDAEKQERP